MGYIGWTIMVVGLCALLALALTSGDIRDRLAGTGDRRISRRARLKELREENKAQREQIAKCPHCTPPEFPTEEQLVVADALAGPGFHVDALADDPTAWINRPDPAPLDSAPRIIADAPAGPDDTEHDTVLLDARRLHGLEVTATLPQIVTTVTPTPRVYPEPLRLDPPPKVTWGITATKPLWEVPAGPGSTSPTEVSRIAGERATVRVATTLDEAS